jgi:hypothetical protein
MKKALCVPLIWSIASSARIVVIAAPESMQ